MAFTVAAVLVVAGVGTLQPVEPPAAVPTQAPFSELHIPRTLHAPDPWTPGTDETGPPGPLAVIANASRNTVDGLTGAHRGYEFFGVSAVDGSAVFLDLPGTRDVRGGVLLGSGAITLSPDGRKVGYIHYDEDAGPSEVHEDLWRPPSVAGWDVYNTVTGEVTELRVPNMPEMRGMDAFEIRFTGDSRYLLTNFSPTGSDGSRDDALFAWDVETGNLVEVEGTGHFWLPTPGSGPKGVVWSRDRRIMTFDPQTGQTTVLGTPHDVVEASYGPDGRALAYVGHRPSKPNQPVPWHLYAGRSAQEVRRLDLGIRGVGQVLGWRSEHEVVLDHRRGLRFVDVRTGESDTVTLGTRGNVMWQLYAADLWRNPLVEGVGSYADDPRWWLRPWAWGAGAVTGAILSLVAVRRRRAGA